MLFRPYKVKMFLSYVIFVSGLVFVAFSCVMVVVEVGSSVLVLCFLLCLLTSDLLSSFFELFNF